MKIPAAISKMNVSQKMAESAFSQLITAYKECKTVHEIEVTKREYISAQRDIALAQIQAQRDILEKYLIQTFSERSKVIGELFRALDRGIDAGDTNLINMVMQGIVATVQVSPLQGVNEFMRQVEDDNVKAIEI